LGQRQAAKLLKGPDRLYETCTCMPRHGAIAAASNTNVFSHTGSYRRMMAISQSAHISALTVSDHGASLTASQLADRVRAEMIPAIVSVSTEGWSSIVRTSAWLSVNVSGYQVYLLSPCYCSNSGACGRQVRVLIVLLHCRFVTRPSVDCNPWMCWQLE
jgi:hypothetical protein